MKEIDKKAKNVLENMLSFIIPAKMTVKQRENLAKKSGLSPETIRTTLKRQSLSADTLIRIMLAVGITENEIINLPVSKLGELKQIDTDWISFGRQLTDNEKKEYLVLLKFLRSEWGLIDKPLKKRPRSKK